ncbi:MAG: radical SAM protein [Myxococcota bacterium]
MSTRLPVVTADEGTVLDGPSAPPWPHQPTVEWQVCGVCNYDCSYCIQSKASRVGHPDDETITRALQLFANLEGIWEIKMTGGEPFAFRGFVERIIPGLCALPHRISVLTNLSAPLSVLERFARLTHGRLNIISASLHLEFTTPDEFLAKLQRVRDMVHADTRMVVNSVLVPERLAEVQVASEKVRAAGFRFFPQLMKVKKGVHAYTREQMEQVRAIVGDLRLAEETRSANMAPAYTGRRCFTGARYFVLLQDGDAWSCRSARRHGEGFLGNLRTGIRLRHGPVLCPYTICPCSVPANRGMIEGVAAHVTREEPDEA